MANVLSLQYLHGVQDNMRLVSENAFGAIGATLQYDKIATTITDQAAEVRLILPIDSETIDYNVDEGYIAFSRLEETSMVFNYQHDTKGLKVTRSEFTDGDYGAKRCADWAKNIGILAAYTPERKTWDLVVSNPVGQLDGLTLFHNAHPLNPKQLATGTYTNRFYGAAAAGSPNNPGACPIDTSVAADVALANLGKAISGVTQVKAANGITPRRLRVKYIIVNAGLEARARQLTGAAFLNNSDVGPIVANQGLQVVMVPELPINTTYYLAVEEVAGSEIGAVVFWEREAFSIHYIDGLTDAQLSAANELHWHGRGREAVFPGLPYKIFRVEPT